MTRVTEAIFANGVLRPVEPLPLREHERVRITVESVEPGDGARRAAVARMVDGFSKLKLQTNGRPTSREQLHERD